MPLLSLTLPITLQLLRCCFLLTSEDYTTSQERCQISFSRKENAGLQARAPAGEENNMPLNALLSWLLPSLDYWIFSPRRANEIDHPQATLLYTNLRTCQTRIHQCCPGLTAEHAETTEKIKTDILCVLSAPGGESGDRAHRQAAARARSPDRRP